MLRRSLWLIFAMLLASCGAETGGASSEPAKPDKASKNEDVSPKGKKWGGWRWKGARDDCFFKHSGRCYNSKKMACRKARCGKRECLMDGSAPANIYCEGDEVKKSDSFKGKSGDAEPAKKKSKKGK